MLIEAQSPGLQLKPQPGVWKGPGLKKVLGVEGDGVWGECSEQSRSEVEV